MEAGRGLGRVHVITGPGKGKTTAAFGIALRAAGHGLKVCVIQFMKTGLTTGETVAIRRIREIQVYQFGTGRFVDPKNITEDDRRRAQEAIDQAKAFLEKGGCDVLILDEINLASYYGLVDREAILSMIRSRKPGIEVVLTGRNAPQEFMDLADYVSSIDNRKHPFKEGVRARQGIEW